MRRLGGQSPTFERIGEWASTRGPEAVEMFEAYGRRYYGSQKHEMDVFFARDADGAFAAMSIGITKPRQNGKSFAVRDYATWMAAVEGKSVLYSSHEGKTVRKMFKEIVGFLEENEDFRDELESIYRAGGYEGIYFRNGACIEFQTRTNSGGRGGTYAVIVFDEAQELTSAQQDAVLPTSSAAGELDEGDADPQMIYIGTVPGPTCGGTVFRELHDRAHGEDTTVWWLEWGAQGATLDDVDTDDVDLWYACNPAMGRRISERTVRNEHDTMSRDGFARERLGWWSPTAGRPQTAVPAEAWAACKVDADAIPRDGVQCFAVKFAPDGSSGALAACRRPDEGAPYVQCIEHRSMGSGVGWFADWLTAREDRAAVVVVDGKSYAGALVERLMQRGFSKLQVVTPKSGDVAKACAMLVEAVESRRLAHAGQTGLDDSAARSAKRKIGNDGGFGFEPTEPDADSTPLEACALALWGAMTTKRDQRRIARVG